MRKNLILCFFIFFLSACGLADYIADRTSNTYKAGQGKRFDTNYTLEEKAFLKTAPIVDLHADSLLWDRGYDFIHPDPEKPVGHIDLKRLYEGGTAIQVFATVSKTPEPLGLLNFVQSGIGDLFDRPVFKTVFGADKVKYRILRQAERLKTYIKKTENRQGAPYLKLVKSKEDIDDIIAAREKGEPVIGALLSIEGVFWVNEGETEENIKKEVDALFDAGFRMVGLTHRCDTSLARSSEGKDPKCDQIAADRFEALSPEGEIFLKALEDKRMIVDLAHMSEEAAQKALNILQKPPVISHTVIKEICLTRPETRDEKCNLRGNGLQTVYRVLNKGGVIGSIFWDELIGPGRHSLVRSIGDSYQLIGKKDGLSLGSDFDGAVSTYIDSSEMAALLIALRRCQYCCFPKEASRRDKAIRGIAGGNALRLFKTTLPASLSN